MGIADSRSPTFYVSQQPPEEAVEDLQAPDEYDNIRRLKEQRTRQRMEPSYRISTYIHAYVCVQWKASILNVTYL